MARTFEAMFQLAGAILTLGYVALFLFLIQRMKLFRVGTIPVQWFQAVFVLKVVSGFLLYLVYTYYYTDRATADIWKYFDDAMVMFSALYSHPVDYVQMLFGIQNDTLHFQQYYDRMNHWYRPYGSSIANDTHTIIRFNAFVRLFSMGFYNVHSVVINFLGLIGLTGIFHFLRHMQPTKERWFFAGVFLMPGILFWASGVLKEPLLFFGLGLFLYGLMRLASEGVATHRILLVGLSLFFLFTVKSYALIALLPGLLAWRICVWFKKLKPVAVFAAVYFLLAVGSVLLSTALPWKSPLKRLAQKQHEFYQLAEGGTYVATSAQDTLYIAAADYELLVFSDHRSRVKPAQSIVATHWRDAKKESAPKVELRAGTKLRVLLDYGKTGSTIAIPRLEPTISSVLKAAPVALLNAAFRPFPWEVTSPFMALSGFENILIALLIVMAAIGGVRRKSCARSPIWFVAVSFALIILVLTGLVTPVVGAIVRYKVPALPFLVCALLFFADTTSLENKLQRVAQLFFQTKRGVKKD